VDGRWRDARSGEDAPVINPATESEITRVGVGGIDDIEDAVTAARRAFDEGSWGRLTVGERTAALARFVDVLHRRRSDFIEVTIREAGAPRKLAEGIQVQVPLDSARDFVERVLPTYGFSQPMAPTFGFGIGQGIVLREPVGVVAAITPFNYPTHTNLSKVMPALAGGNTVILKPSPYTPLAALLLAEIAEEAELPPGVFNVVTAGPEASRRLTSHPAIDMVTFTGSETIGQQVMAQAAATSKKVLLELGGKSANVLFEDANLDKAIAHAGLSFTRHSGQGCACLTRILAHESIHDEVVERLSAFLATLKIGDPYDPDTDMGPLISERQRQRVERYVGIGRDEGCDLAYGGRRPENLIHGFFVQPSLFGNVKNSATIAQEEIFGPVGVVIPFQHDDEAVTIANDSRYGLSGAVWSADTKRAFAVAKRIRTGGVTINGGGGGTNPYAPFGGYKNSGVGREVGEAGLSEYLETKSVTWGVSAG
jgi:aldehyde dehydrogenase (NAD+)